MRVVRRERQKMIRKIPAVWQEGVYDEGGEEGEAEDDKEDTCSLARGSI
jgi:hypothetical protein